MTVRTLSMIFSVGAYGFDGESFVDALVAHQVDALVDIRQRRGVRGKTHAFANISRLLALLSGCSIPYVYLKSLAPSTEIRQLQLNEDDAASVTKGSRRSLSAVFSSAYIDNVLSRFEPENFLFALPPSAVRPALFCVERFPQACHRSLVADFLSRNLDVPIGHIGP